jgi:hypothetical protein
MTEVFFRGWGSWYQLNNPPTADLITNYYASGVFRLTDADEIAYIHTGKLPQDVMRLLPSGTRPDCAFLRLVQSGMLFGRDLELEKCVFDIDCNQDKDMVLVIAKPYTPTNVRAIQNNTGKTGGRNRGQTQINIFLTELCQKQDLTSLSAESLVRAIKPLVSKPNCPVEKYHGFYNEVCVDWKPGTGSAQGSWGKKSFQNFVGEFKRSNS